MPKANTGRRRRAPLIVAAVVQPVARRLSRMEALLIEMRHEQDIHLKRIAALKEQFDELTEHVDELTEHVKVTNRRRISRRRK